MTKTEEGLLAGWALLMPIGRAFNLSDSTTSRLFNLPGAPEVRIWKRRAYVDPDKAVAWIMRQRPRRAHRAITR